MENKNKRTVAILVIVIVLLALAVLYAFVLRPKISGYVVNKQVGAYRQAQADLINNMLVQLQQTGRVQFPIGNYTLVMAGKLVPNQQTSAQQQPAQ